MQVDLTQIILAVIALLGAVLTTFVIPWLKGKMSAQQLATMNNAIKVAVYAAEQMFTPEKWMEKKAWVVSLLQKQGYDANIAAIDAAIEAEVLALHKALKDGESNAVV